MRTEGD